MSTLIALAALLVLAYVWTLVAILAWRREMADDESNDVGARRVREYLGVGR